MMFITILLSFIVIIVYSYYAHYRRKRQLIELIPGPRPLGYSFIGNTLQILGSREEQFKKLVNFFDQYYPICKIWSFFYAVIIRHPNDLEIILTHTQHIEKSNIYDIIKPWLGTGLGISKAAKWHSRRKILNSAFHFNILQQFLDILIEESENMTNSLRNTGDTVVNDLLSFVSEHTLNAICETAMGISLKDLGALQQRYRKATQQMSELFIYRLFRPWLHFDWIFSLTPTSREQTKILKILHGFTERIIAERRLYHERTNGQYLKEFSNDTLAERDDVETIGTKRKRLAMLDLLIAASCDGLMTDLDIREEVDTFVVAAHDTTAKAICFILLLLAEHKNIQDRARNEIDTAMRQNEEKFTKELLQQLSYLDRCIKEALRLYPSVPFISRVLGKDVKLQSYLVRAGTTTFINIYGVHRDPNFWPNPDIFDPDRFLPENIRNRHPYSYIPFSAGPRNCIGQRFAMLEMKAMIASLIHNFYLEPVDYLKDLQLQADITLCSTHPLRVKFVPVCKQQFSRLMKFFDEYNPICRMWLVFFSFVSIRHPDDIEVILSSKKHNEKSVVYDIAKPWFGTGLVTSKGEKWHSHRKILTPTFHFDILKQFVNILIEAAEDMTNSLKNTEETVVNDLVSFISKHTLSIICETAMGISLKNLGAFREQYQEANHQMSELLTYRFFRPWLHFNWIFSLTPQGRQQTKVLKILHGFAERIIAERKLYHERTNGQYLEGFGNDISADKDDAERTGTRRKQLAMLDLLIAASRDGFMTDLDIREQVDTFIFAGHDTTAKGVCFTLMLLAEHKNVQDRIRNEINTAMRENKEKFTMELLQQLPYLERCIKEALRLYPSAPILSRTSGEDIKLQTYLVPTGTVLGINIFGVHRDPKFWPNPNTFDPDRFLPENARNRHPYSYIPFSAGPRNCIGQRFAMLELKAMIASLIHNFYLEPIDYLKNLRLQANFTLCPTHPLRIKFVPVYKINANI
ncbi:PREDICTED: cytochrome P450 4C1-like [Cyphomyrmex costatus]|uniref:cytochrome P450 4C1-like n=1 Tax=Cyphomyrmex costatus TaxID=456900 RepID=UPI000852373B|nr:PREDICTED: cytochrome P450 4C1-like [Cyphomyrmex costatus]